MKNELIESKSIEAISTSDLEGKSVEQEVALRILHESELLLIGGGGGDVVFG